MKVLITESQMQQISGLSDLELFQMIQHAITQTTRWHHATKGFAEHEALGKFYNGLSELQDELMETFIGATGMVNNNDFGMKYKKYDKGIATRYFQRFRDKMYAIKNEIPYGDIQNLIDEITALTNKTLFLLTLS